VGGAQTDPKRAAIVIDEGWTIVCHETVTEPLEQTPHPPVEKAGETLQELGFHVSVPTVRYDY
jgi:hypothetical protein